MEAGLCSLRGLIPAYARVEHTPGCQWSPHFCLCLSPWCSSSAALAPPSPLQSHCTILNRCQGEAGVRCCPPFAPGELGRETEPWLEGIGGLLIYFSFFWGFPSLSQFSFPPCGINHSLPPIPDLCPQPGRWAGSKRREWDLFLCGWFLLMI